MKVFFDTNVLIAAFLTRGVCAELFEYCLTEHKICISKEVADEVFNKLSKKFNFPDAKVKQITAFIKENSLTVTHAGLQSPACRDPDDDLILAAALEGAVDCLVTGDEDLLILKTFKGIPIIKSSDFWKFEKTQV